MTEFVPFPKVARLNRAITITEKIDGTNASIYIGEDGEFKCGSRTRWLTLLDDNYGFAKWAYDHKDELMGLGVGRHFGEWWGKGINRGYGVTDKRFSLFNTVRWCNYGSTPRPRLTANTFNTNREPPKLQDVLPACVSLVPVLYVGVFSENAVTLCLAALKDDGSRAAPFMNPEGVVVFHLANNTAYKVTLDDDGAGKGHNYAGV